MHAAALIGECIGETMFDYYKNLIGQHVRVTLQCSKDRTWLYDGVVVGIGEIHVFLKQSNGEVVLLALTAIQSIVPRKEGSK
jgi:hypothetical protein